MSKNSILLGNGEEITPPTPKGSWNLYNLPPEGHSEVGSYFNTLFEDALRERDTLGLPDKWLANYTLFRNASSRTVSSVLSFRSRAKLSLALLSSNIQRTVANITARQPVCEVKTNNSGVEEGIDKIIQAKVNKWNEHDKEFRFLSSSALNMEVYGIAIEKYIWDSRLNIPTTVNVDPYSFLCCPGNYKDISLEAPYVCHMYALPVEEIKAKYGVDVVESEYEASVLGPERSDVISASGTSFRSINAAGNYVKVSHPRPDDSILLRKALVIEIWIRDHSVVTVDDVDSPIPYTLEEYASEYGSEAAAKISLDIESGAVTGFPAKAYNKRTEYKYPGCIRVVTITNGGTVVLSDVANPSINLAHPELYAKECYLYNRFAFGKANSYEDTDSIWGFSQAELVADINLAIDDIWSEIVSYLRMSLFPPLILPQDCKISKNEIRYLPKLVLQPVSRSAAEGIKWLNMPAPPTWLFEVLKTLMSFFDRISQIEGADRGENNKSVIAASAIQMLQERGAALVQAKVDAIDCLIRRRGASYISLYQNFGTEKEVVDVDGKDAVVLGTDLISYRLEFSVESGSTVARTPSQSAEQALRLYEIKAIDREALLSSLNFPDWRRVCERLGESELDAALGVLIAAGMDENTASSLKSQLMMNQTNPSENSGSTPAPNGNSRSKGQAGAPAKPGIPKASQGGE